MSYKEQRALQNGYSQNLKPSSFNIHSSESHLWKHSNSQLTVYRICKNKNPPSTGPAHKYLTVVYVTGNIHHAINVYHHCTGTVQEPSIRHKNELTSGPVSVLESDDRTPISSVFMQIEPSSISISVSFSPLIPSIFFCKIMNKTKFC